MRELSVFIGRFSPFHNGHSRILERALLSSNNVLVLIGSSCTSRNIKNPFTFQERADMIFNWYEDNCMAGWAKLRILPLVDHPYNDSKWIAQVQESVTKYYPSVKKPTLVGATRDESGWYLKAFGSFFELDVQKYPEDNWDINATSIREQYFTGGQWSNIPLTTSAFLHKFETTKEFNRLYEEYVFVKKYKEAWSKAPYPPTFVTVDAVVIQSGHILLVRRDAYPGRGLLALPGGFLEQTERIQDAAVRELLEETRIEMSKAQLNGSITDSKVFDDPNRSTRGRTITHAFTFKLRDELPLPRVKPQLSEVTSVQWYPLGEVLNNTEIWYEDHHAIASTMIDRAK